MGLHEVLNTEELRLFVKQWYKDKAKELISNCNKLYPAKNKIIMNSTRNRYRK